MAATVGIREWLENNKEFVSKADDVLASRLTDRKVFGDHTSTELCQEVFSIVSQSLGNESGEGSVSSSVLLLGEAGSGKTHAVEWCIGQLAEVQKSLVVLRAFGTAYATDVECIRHLATQVAGQLSEAPRANASFEAGMEWLRKVLSDRFKEASAAVMVLDRFEHFCTRARQTLLYNLFDIAQEVGVRLSIIGMSERMDVMGMLEKRIKSRFSMRHLHAFLPNTMEEMVKVLMSKLRLSAAGDLKPKFVQDYNRFVEAALKAKSAQWAHHLELGRPPLWFLWQCLPVAAFLHDASPSGAASASSATSTPAAPTKRARFSAAPGCLPSATNEEVKMLLMSTLAETEHIVLIALFRLQNRSVGGSLAAVLHEVQLLHESGGGVSKFVTDRYTAAFSLVVRQKFVEMATQGCGETPTRYVPCHSLVHNNYQTFVQDLEFNALPWNPLRSLPQRVQQWAKPMS